MMRRILAVAVLATALITPGAGNADPPNCFDRSHEVFARFITPSGGSAQVTTGPTGTTTIQTGGPIPSVFLSTTGSIQVEIEQACLHALSMTVTKTGTGVVHTRTWELDCAHNNLFDSVPIGLDGGEYQFSLTGLTCDGKPLRGDGNGGYVADPPIL